MKDEKLKLPEYTTIDKFLNLATNIFFSIQFEDNKTFFSPSVKAITGYAPEEILNFPNMLTSLIIDEDFKKVENFHDKIAANSSTEKVFEESFHITSKEGKKITLYEISQVIKNDKKNIDCIESVFINTDRLDNNSKNIKDEIQKLRKLNAAKDKFISIISHDLRAPFTSLLGFSEILLNEPDLPEKETREYLQYIYDASKTQLQLINYLLDWSKLQTGQIKIQPQRLNLRYLISTAVSILTGMAIRKGVQIETDVSGDFYVYVDERLINQVLTNLIGNSIKFTPTGEKIFISANKFKKGLIEVIIKDNGIGISENDQMKLFKIDEKFSLDGTEGEKGSGLGLALVKEIIEKHKGDIWFYSKLNEGTEFHFTLPEAITKVLIVENNIALAALITEAVRLALPEAEITECKNGYEAISFILKEPPTLVITEHQMPLMNGIQIVSAMQNKKNDINLPIIVISENFSKEDLSMYNKLGIKNILSVPFEQQKLIEIIKSFVFVPNKVYPKSYV